MFGYIRPQHYELKVKEYELYKSTYCGLCRVMGKNYSYLYKMTLSYDFVFMVLLRLLVCPENVSFSKKRCIAHPFKKRSVMDPNSALETAADVGIIMLYSNLEDKIRDKDGKSAFLSRIILPNIRRMRKKAIKKQHIANFDNTMKERLLNLEKIEKDNLPSLDSGAEEFGAILAEAVSVGLENTPKRISYEIGKHIGRWIYMTDAVDDLPKDEKNSCYNPLLAVFGSPDELKKHIENVRIALLNELSSADKALALADNTDSGVMNILNNIIRLGLPEVHDKIIEEHKYDRPV